MPVTQTVTCPVGGETVTYTTTMSNSTWGARPDGKPYGSWTYPFELPICPTNKLVMYRKFSEQEIARLPKILQSTAYLNISQSETPYYRAAWLERALVPNSDAALGLLMQASWESDKDSPRKARYQAEYVGAVDAIPGPLTATVAGLSRQIRAANAERELGRFDAARARLARLTFDAAGDGRVGAQEFVQRLDKISARGDASAEPLDLLPTRVAASICLAGVSATGVTAPDEFCKAEPMATEVARLKETRERMMQMIGRSPTR